MPFFPHSPNIKFPVFSDHKSFIHTYKMTIRRAVACHADDPHYHEIFSIWYNLSGEYEMYFNGETIRCTPGTLIFMPPFATHAMNTENIDLKKTEIISISFPRDALRNRKTPVYPLSYNKIACGRKTVPLCLHLVGAEKDEADKLFSESLSEYSKRSDMHRTRIFENIDGIIKLLLRHSEKTLTASSLSAAIKRSDDIAKIAGDVFLNYTKSPSLPQSAKELGMTERGLRKLFKSITDTTHREFSAAIRAMEAVKLLKFTSKSIAEIADECGYTDNSHLTKTFINLFGSAPLQLRRDMIANEKQKASEQQTSLYPHIWESYLDSETIEKHRLTALGMSDE